ncbi:poly(ethylene terephthalate) hydrolase family protein [Sphingobacterium corticibacter]|uniref:Adenylate cyclase n=1 Tax=Sphingobacterium corticibacter TaxID=2171749 RepID=A0A2T8HM93_9SPHI|nr:adenylate cyclase [Sphingobacterium corticibacter]PVH26547.1 adenylate cyclase [Sphingobacterium corticibacter]
MKNLSPILLLLLVILSSCEKKESLLEAENATVDEALNDETQAVGIADLFKINFTEQILKLISPVIKSQPAFGLANAEYNKLGPYSVSTINATRQNCKGFAGSIQNILGSLKIVDPNVRCNDAFPYGFADRRVTEVFYPSNIESLGKVPVINFVGGLLSNAANYDAIINLWTSYGFIVVNTNNFINFSPSLQVTGLTEIVDQNRNPESPLYNKVDLSRILVSGHSAGGGSAILITAVPPKTLQTIDPEIRIVGSFPLQASFNATGVGVNVPTLILTGEINLIVPPILQGLKWQYRFIKKVPAWYMVTKNSNHGTPVLELARNDYAGITVAWILYRGKNDAAASRYFIGSSYLATQDPAFIQGIANPLRIRRNKLAEKL